MLNSSYQAAAELYTPDTLVDVGIGRISVSLYDQINHLMHLREDLHYGKHPQDIQVSTIKRVNASLTVSFAALRRRF